MLFAMDIGLPQESEILKVNFKFQSKISYHNTGDTKIINFNLLYN